MTSRRIDNPIEGGSNDPSGMFRISNLNCMSVGDNDDGAPDGVVSDVVRTTSQDYHHGMEIGNFASKWKWQQKMHLIRLRKKTTVPKIYVWDLPPSACVGASSVCVWL